MKTRLLLIFLQYVFFIQLIWSNGVVIVDGSLGIYLTLKSSDVRVNVNNQIAVVTTKQIFYNQTGQLTPIKYAFPIHNKANAIELRWYINGQWHKAIVSKSVQNDSIPGDPGGQVDPDLATYLGETPLFFTINDFIGIDSSVIFELKYVELLPYSFGEVSFNYPNKYSIIQGAQIVDRQYLSFHLQSDRTIENVEMDDLNATISLMPHDALVTFELTESPANDNYTIRYQLSSTELGVFSMSTLLPDSLLHCDELGNGFVSLIIEPEANANTEIIEKNFSLIVDRSGSMSGIKIEQAKNAASFIVNNLNEGDRFNIIDFDSNVKTLFPALTSYNLTSKNQALAYIQNITAGGSTNISDALTTSIQQFLSTDTTKANIIIFFTDGMATAGITNTDAILEAVQSLVSALETEIFIFTFGIGGDVNKKLLTELALQNNGLSSFLGNDELEEKITSFFLTVNNPVLLNTHYTFDPDIITGIYPDPLPNLYKGQQLILSGRYEIPATVDLHLTGNAFSLPVHYIFQIHLADSNDVEKSFLPKIWAKQTIDDLTIDFNLADDQETSDVIQSVIDSLSICYGVISTEFTSFEDGGDITSVEFDEITLTEKFNIIITPNPFSNELTIYVFAKDEYFGEIGISIMNSAGEKIMDYHRRLNGRESSFDISELDSLPAGIYFIVFRIGDEVLIRKVFKN